MPSCKISRRPIGFNDQLLAALLNAKVIIPSESQFTNRPRQKTSYDLTIHAVPMKDAVSSKKGCICCITHKNRRRPKRKTTTKLKKKSQDEDVNTQ